MKTVSIREARARLAELAREVEAGERIAVTRHGKPVLEMVKPARADGVDLESGRACLKSLGVEKAQSWIAPDFDDPLPDDVLLRPLPESPKPVRG
jgi:antitoxin (DNA-binding transcriptional repressor) of toxin-antitoxin stability system